MGQDHTEPTARVVLPPTSTTPGAARRFAREFRRRFGVDCDHLELIVSELVTNAVRHASGDIEVTLSLSESHVRLQVRDNSREAPRTTAAGTGDRSGRGLAIVEVLAGGWVVDWHDDGTKTVSAKIPLRACGPTTDPARDPTRG